MRRRGAEPPIVDTVDVLGAPEAVLRRVCDSVGVEFRPSMLHWPAGPRPTDGVWARHWYRAVEASTGFQTYAPKGIEVPDELRAVLRQAEELYEVLAAHRLRA
jgi:hypothetical protein